MPRFRQRLVALVDALLEGDRQAPFLLDGQGITLADYLSVRPEAFERIGSALRSGRMEAGPWYVLADNLIPSGEAIVRNLEAGRRMLKRLGARAPRVAYCPDSFGHPSALPAIAAGFGLSAAVVWRGAGGTSTPVGDAFWWCGPEGSCVLTCHLPPDGYESGCALPSDAEGARARWRQLQTMFSQRLRTNVALLLNGADHHARQPDLNLAIRALGLAAGDAVDIRVSTLQEWAGAFLCAASRRELPKYSGELRDSYGYTWSLGGTLATRAHQKRNNARLERGLLRDVEPWLALVRIHDTAGATATVSPAARLTMAQLPRLLEVAWESLLSTHPHDTLCGCSVDTVSRTMESVQESVAEQGRGLREAALQLALNHDVVAVRSRILSCGPLSVVLRNRVPRPRHGLAYVTFRRTVRDVPVGPGSVTRPVAQREAPAHVPDDTTSGRQMAVSLPDSLIDSTRWMPAGRQPSIKASLIQSLGSPALEWSRRESPQHYPDNDLVAGQRVLAWVGEVPPLGLMAGDFDQMLSHPAPPPPVVVTRLGGVITLDNGLVRVSVDEAAQVKVISGCRVLHDALIIETSSDVGDSYTSSPHNSQRLRVAAVRIAERGPLRGAITMSWIAGTPSDSGSSMGGDGVHVQTTVRLVAGRSTVECRVRISNHRTNHRLRLVWRTDVIGGERLADAAFGPVSRPVIQAPPTSLESVPDGMPLHRWVLHRSGSRAAALISDGLAEAHAEDGHLAVTLLRATGELSRASVPERPGHAGWPAAIPDAQCRGTYYALIGLLLSEEGAERLLERIERACDDLLLPLVGETWRDLEVSDGPVAVVGPRLTGEGLEMSAVTLSSCDPSAVVLRAVNCLERAVTGCWELPGPPGWVATQCRLDETPTGGQVVCQSALEFSAAPRSVVTFVVRRERENHTGETMR